MPSLDRDGNVFILNLGDGENRFNPEWVGAFNEQLDLVEAGATPKALVLSNGGKIWSNGLDLAWFAENVPKVPAFVTEVHEMLARMLSFPVPTIAAVNGHAFAGGAMLALGADERIMREDRGYFCLPEIDIRIPFTPGMGAMIQARLFGHTQHEAMTTGRRYGGPEAVAAGIAQAAVAEDQVLPAAIERAAALAEKDGGTLKVIKERMYASALATLRDPVANAIPGLEQGE